MSAFTRGLHCEFSNCEGSQYPMADSRKIPIRGKMRFTAYCDEHHNLPEDVLAKDLQAQYPA